MEYPKPVPVLEPLCDEDALSEYPEYAQIKHCVNCGTISTYLNTCPYCGEKVND